MDSFMYLITMIEESWLYFDTASGYTQSTAAKAHPRLCVNPERAQRITAYSRQLGKHYYSPYYLNQDVNRVLTALANDEDLRIPPSALARELVEHALPNGLDGISLLKLCTTEHAINFAHQGARYVVAAQSGLIKGIPYLYEHVAQMITVVRHAFENQEPTFTVACALSNANTIPVTHSLVAGAQPSTNREFLVEGSRGVRTSQGKTLREAMDDLLFHISEPHASSGTPTEAPTHIDTHIGAVTQNAPGTAPLSARSNTFESVMKEKVLEQLRKNPNGYTSMPALYNQLSPFFSQHISSSLMSLEKDGLVIKKDSMHYAALDRSPQTASEGSGAAQSSECANTNNINTDVRADATCSGTPLEQRHQNPAPTQTRSSITQPTEKADAESLWRKTVKAISLQDSSVSALLEETHVKLDDGSRLLISFPSNCAFSKRMASADSVMAIIETHALKLFGQRAIKFIFDDQPTRKATSQQEPVNISPVASPQPDATKKQIEPQAAATPLFPEFAPFVFNTKAGAVYFLTVLGVSVPDICSILKINQSQYHLLHNDGFDMACNPSRYDEPRRRDAALCNRLDNLRQSEKRLLIQFFTHKIAYNPGSNRSKEDCQHVEALDRIFDSLALYHEKKAPAAAPHHHEVPPADTAKPNVTPGGTPANPARKPQMLPCHPAYPMADLDEPACAPSGVALPLCFWPYPFKRMDHRLLFCHLLGGGRYQIAKAFGITAQKYDAQLEKACFSTPLVKSATYRTKRYRYRVDLAKVNIDSVEHSGDPMAFAISLPKPVKGYLLHWLLGEDDQEIARSIEMPVDSIPTYRQRLAQLQLAWANNSNAQNDKSAAQAAERANEQTHKSACTPLSTPSPAARVNGHVTESPNTSSRTTQATSVATSPVRQQSRHVAHRVAPGHLPPTAKPFPSLENYPMASIDQQQAPMAGQAISLEYWPYPFAEQSDQALFLLLLGANNGEISRMLNVTWHAADRLTKNARLRHHKLANAITQHDSGRASINMKQLNLTALRDKHDPFGFIASLMTPQRQFLLHWIMGEDDDAIAKTLNISANRIPAYHLAIVRAQNDWVIERKTNASSRLASHVEARVDRQIAATQQAAPAVPFSADTAPVLKSTAAPNAAVPSYIPRTIQTPLFQIGIPGKPKEATCRGPIQDQLFASGPTQASLFDQQGVQAQSLAVSHGAVITAPITYSEWLRTLDDFTASVMRAKIEEGSHASVVQKFQATHRQCRLAYDKAMQNKPHLVEEQYLYLMETYDIDESRFTKLTGLTSGSYRYLCHTRKQRGVRLLDQYGPDDPKLPASLRNKLGDKAEANNVQPANPLNMMRVGDTYTPKTFRHVAIALGKQLAVTKAITVGQFQREYKRVLTENHLSAEALLPSPDNPQKFIQALGNTNHFLTPKKDRIRYYDFASHDLSLIASMLKHEAARNIECSASLLFDEHRALMDGLDIRDCFELHAIIKRVVHDYRIHAVTINNIPLITLGKAKRRDQVLAIIKELSPCSADEIATEYQERYGVNASTVKSSYLADFQAYRKDGRYECRDTNLTDQQLDSLRRLLVNDCHALSSIKSRYVAANPGASALDITDEQLALVGYYSSHGLAIRKGLEPKRLFSERIDRHQQFKAGDPGFEDDVMGHPAFRVELTSRLSSYAYVQPEPNFYLSVSWLQSRFGVTADMLRDYGEQVAAQAEPGVPFSIHSLARSGFLHEVDLLREEADFKDCFYETLIEALPAWKQIKRTSYEGTKVYCLSETPFSISDIINYIARREGAIELESLLDLLEDEYAIKTTVNSLRARIERACQDAGVFYNQQFETLLPSKGANAAFLLDQIRG